MADDPLAHLRGSCACDRNQYTISLPKSRPALASAEVFLDSSRANRWAHEPLYLRVPLSWYQSATYAAYPDESHAAIRRSFHTPFGPPRRRQFCGFCGTGLASWDEGGRGECVDVLVGSLGRESVGVLEEVGLLGGMGGEEEEEGGESGEGDVVLRTREDRAVGTPYYEEVTDMGRRGRIKRRKGGQTSADGGTTVDWEVVELEGGEDGDLVMEESVVEHSSGSSSASGNKRQKTSG